MRTQFFGSFYGWLCGMLVCYSPLGSAFAGFLAAAVCTLEEAVVLLFVAKAKLG